MGWSRLIAVDRCTPGRGVVVEVPGRCALAVFLAEGKPYVVGNECPHRHGDLGAGDLFEGKVFCPLHAWPFDLVSGRSPTHPEASVPVFPSRIQEGWVEADVDAAAAAGSTPLTQPAEVR